MPESIALAVLGRYFDGTASAEERAAVELWVGPDPGRRAMVAELQAAWVAEARRLDAPYDAEIAWGRVARRIQRSDPPKVTTRLALAPPGEPSRLGRRAPFWEPLWSASKRGSWAAGIAVVAAAAGALWLERSGRQPPPAAQAAPMRDYATARGQRAVVRLLDGTEVTLNVASRLRVPAAFGPARRDVYLDGEAYFSVIHDSLRPFAVHTQRGITRDLGTKFDVRAYGEEAAERVAVAEGAVAVAAAVGPQGPQGPRGGDSVSPTVRHTATEVPVHAGQVATLSRAGRVRVDPTANVAHELAWTRGRLEFEGVPLGDAARRLGRWYDLDVRVTDPNLARRPVTGSYGDEPITHVLTVITAAVGARYELQGRSVTISAAGGARRRPAPRSPPT